MCYFTQLIAYKIPGAEKSRQFYKKQAFMKADQLLFQQEKWEGLDQLHYPPEDYQLLLLFADKKWLLNPEMIHSLRQLFPHSTIVSSSTAGEIYNGAGHEGSAVCIPVHFDHTRFEVACDQLDHFPGSFELGQALAGQLSRKDLSYAFLISDGHIVNGSDLIAGIMDILGNEIPISGGMAGDGSKFSETITGVNENLGQGYVILIGFYGNRLQVGISVQRGFTFLGPERIVTRSDKNILYDIDGKNALELYKTYLGKYSEELPGSALLFPIAIIGESNAEPLVRTILSINEAEGSMIFAGNLPEGSRIRLMHSNLNHLIEYAREGGKQSSNRFMHPPALALVMNCVGRKTILQSRKNEEIEELTKVFDRQTMVAGFYTYGEFSSWENPAKVCDLHNQTVVVTVLDEL
jgi:hypothetical protein